MKRPETSKVVTAATFAAETASAVTAAGAFGYLEEQPVFLVFDLRLHLFEQVADLAVVGCGLPAKRDSNININIINHFILCVLFCKNL